MKNRRRGLFSMERAPGRPDYEFSILKGGLQEWLIFFGKACSERTKAKSVKLKEIQLIYKEKYF